VQEKQIHATVDSKAVVVTEASIRSSLLLNDVDGTACLTNEAIFQNLALMGDSLEGTTGSEGDQVQSSHDSPLSGDHTSKKAEGGLNLEELFFLCTNLSNKVLALETSKEAQAAKILKLKDQIKKLKRNPPYGTIDKEVYVSQPSGFVDPKYPKKVYKVVKALYGLHQAPRAWISKEKLTFFLRLQVKQKEDGIFISRDKYVVEILKKFDFASVKTASTPIETQKPLVKDEEATDVDVHLYRSMIGFLMYLTASRPDIMFAVCACSRFQVTPKISYLNTMKRIFRYLKGKPKLGLWYPRVSSFDLEAYSDSDYVGVNLDRKSTTRGCQFLGRRLISWQCKKQIIVATSTTEAEYVAAANYYRQVLWIQNQMLDYGFNFMNTKIYIDNKSTICIVKNPVFHSKTKHIEIRHHFIRDAYEKKLISLYEVLCEQKDLDDAALEYCPKHNMIAYLEKTDGNAEFHEIMDFLTRNSIYYTLTLSPVVSTTFVEQFWMSAKSKTINNVSYITATVAGKPVTISKAIELMK
ncbi:putative ribonuclease H-like domain-containing protein, partial [Tanacetum coccineum]